MSWNSSFTNSETVQIYLSYGDNTLLLASNVSNSGNTTTVPNFGFDPSHLLVPNNTTGDWVVSDVSGSVSSSSVQIYQPITFSAMGSVLDLGTSFEVSVTLNSLFSFSTSNFSSSLVYLNGSSWVLAYTFDTQR